ncbi:MAG: Fic family protein [Candidatus Margulisbacteria bacterium]|nr:Fic family protein [Candidatus Margulisiibacteriota bacterium]
MTEFQLNQLPPLVNFETIKILKALSGAHRYLAELKGYAETLPNQNILINTLSLQEAKDSSAIENIITTHDELYKQTISQSNKSSAAKEVEHYSKALKSGFDRVIEDKLLTNRHIIAIQSILEGNTAGFRKLPGTKLINDQTGATIYTPPQDAKIVAQYMTNLERYINAEEDSVDPLIKMAVIHFQFESVHPFYDGNGRTGRIINMLYLVQKGLLNIPILYMSRYIIQTKDQYYKNLQNVREHNDWETWIAYMLNGIEQTAIETIQTIQKIKKLFNKTKHHIRKSHKFYSQDLINNLLSHPYTKIEFLVEELNITRITATKYLETLVQDGILKKEKVGRSNFYINTELFEILKGVESLSS